MVSQLHSTRDCKTCLLLSLFRFAQFIVPYLVRRIINVSARFLLFCIPFSFLKWVRAPARFSTCGADSHALCLPQREALTSLPCREIRPPRLAAKLGHKCPKTAFSWLGIELSGYRRKTPTRACCGLTGAQVPQAADYAGRAFSLENTGVSVLSGSQGTVNSAPLEVASLAPLASFAEAKKICTSRCPLLLRLWKDTPFSSKA